MMGFYVSLAIALVFVAGIYVLYWSRLRKKEVKYGCAQMGIVFLSPVIFFTVLTFLPIYYLEPFSGKVIDEETGESIPEAVVLVVYKFKGPTLAGAVGSDVDVREIMTDENGEFRLEPKWELHIFKTGWPYGKVIAWKPGYREDWKNFPNFPNSFWNANEKKRFGSPPYTVYSLLKLDTKEERMVNLHRIYTGFSKGKIPNYYRLLNEEREFLNLSQY